MTSTPHDALFKFIFSQTDHAKSALRQALPAALSAAIDWSTLTLESTSFVDEALKDKHCDLLFSVMLDGKPIYLYLLFEHQSPVDPLMPFRLLVYMVRIWEAHLRDHPDDKRLPAILPVVIHHSEAGWTATTSFEQVLNLDDATLAAVGEHVPRFRFILDDISHETDAALKLRSMTALGRLGLFCLRHSRKPERLVRNMRKWATLVREVV